MGEVDGVPVPWAKVELGCGREGRRTDTGFLSPSRLLGGENSITISPIFPGGGRVMG